MQLIEQYHDLFDAQALSMELRRHGILTHISSKHSHAMSGFITGTFKVGLWTVLDSQHQDACAFIANPNHTITSGLSEEEIQRMESQAGQRSNNLFMRFITVAFASIIALLGIAFFCVNS